MKKGYSIFIIILTLGAIAVLLYFYFHIENKVFTENFSLNKEIFLSEEDESLGSLNIDLNVDIPMEYSDYEVLMKIKQGIYEALFSDNYNLIDADSALNSFADILAEEYIYSNAEFAENISDSSFLVFNNIHSLEGFNLLSDENLYSYGIVRFVDFGGAHPLRTRYFYNFDLKTGDIILENDIFRAGYERRLASMMRDIFAEDLDSKNMNEDSPIDMAEYDILAIKPNGNFYINNEGICYVFNPYDIAPYYLGETEIMLPYEKIKILMKNDSPLQYLCKKAIKDIN